jgi:hypothetical protein
LGAQHSESAQEVVMSEAIVPTRTYLVRLVRPAFEETIVRVDVPIDAANADLWAARAAEEQAAATEFLNWRSHATGDAQEAGVVPAAEVADDDALAAWVRDARDG